MADKYCTDRLKMSENNPEDSRNEDSTLKTGGRRSTDKPERAVYRPRSGMTIKRSEPSGESWRSSKSPSPSPAELHVKNRRNQNRQVERNHKDNRDLDLKISSNSNSSQGKEVDQKMKELTISTDMGHIDLTVSSNPSSEEKKKTKKPEQAIYVPKPAMQEQKPAKLDWAAQMEEVGFEEDAKSDGRDRNKGRRKPKRRNGGRDEKERYVGDARAERSYGRSEESDRDANKSQNNAKTEPREVRQVSEPRFPPGGGRGAPHPRGRDSRSMEHGGWSGENHGWSGDRNSSKPPPSRRGPPPPNYETLPPRLKKKFLEEQGSRLGSSAGYSEEPWDGGSLSFSNHHQGPPPQQWTNTVPPPRGRGRGRGKYQDSSFADRRPGESWNQDRWTDQRKERDVNGVAKPEPELKPKPDAARSKQSDDDVGVTSARSKLSEDSWKEDRSGQGQSSSSSQPLSHRSGSSYMSEGESSGRKSPEPAKAAVSAPVLLPLHSTPAKKINWSEIVEAAEREEMSRSSSQNSLNQHSFPLPNIPPSRPREKRKRRGKERSHSRDSTGGGGSGGAGGGGRSRGRRDRRTSEESSGRGSSRDRNKGHYGFHGASSRETSRERTDWRRGSSGSGVVAAGSSGGTSDVTSSGQGREESWRKSGSEERGSWRSGPTSGAVSSSSATASAAPPTASAAASGTPAASAAASTPGHVGYPVRGFIQVHPTPQRQLFDPANPGRPIIVNPSNVRPPAVQQSPQEKATISAPSLHHVAPVFAPVTSSSDPGPMRVEQPPPPASAYLGATERCDEPLERHPRHLGILKSMEVAEMDLYYMIGMASTSGIMSLWPRIHHARHHLQTILMEVAVTDLKFCLTEHVDQHIWRSTYYNIIEALKSYMTCNVETREYFRKCLLGIVEEGFQYFEKLIKLLEDTYKFKLDDFVTEAGTPERVGFVSLAVNLAQKLLLCLGDLARYKEHVCEGVNYGKAKLYYTKAQLLNPKNGRPYYQLGSIATSAKRKMDAIYYYMRSLMATQPLTSARESLLLLFEENRKKLESVSKSRSEERLTEKESRESTSLRREIWVHPTGGRRRVHRTTSTSTDSRRVDSEEEDLSNLSSVDINRRFTTSYLHVHGKIFSKVGMESFQDAAMQMLKEFRALLHQRPLPVNVTRFLQLTALNIFSIEQAKLKDQSLEKGYRSAVQVSALIASLQMLNFMLERSLCLLREQVEQRGQHLHEDLLLLLPAIKIWCDWLLTHASMWNPPPCCTEFRVGPPGDCWVRLAALVNFLEEHPFWKVPIVTKNVEGYVPVRLPEDSALAGFTPLMVCDQDQVYTPPDTDMEAAQCCLRFRKILFFATEFLCGIEPPVLKMQKEENRQCYVSVVNTAGPSPTNIPYDDQSDADLLVESFSEGEEDSDDRLAPPPPSSDSSAGAETRRLLHRKEVLERRHQRQQRHRRRVQAILEQNGLSVVVEVRPKYLVPDTNCFIDYLADLKMIASTIVSNSTEPCYILTVPLIVVTELEGLSRGSRDRDMTGMSLGVQAHNATVSEDARQALSFLRSPARNVTSVRCVTPSGKVINSFTPFAVDGDADRNVTNDDKILTTCLSLCRSSAKEETVKPGEPRRLAREVVLLTEDRHLRVKALARDVPVREVRDFVQWAGLG